MKSIFPTRDQQLTVRVWRKKKNRFVLLIALTATYVLNMFGGAFRLRAVSLKLWQSKWPMKTKVHITRSQSEFKVKTNAGDQVRHWFNLHLKGQRENKGIYFKKPIRIQSKNKRGKLTLVTKSTIGLICICGGSARFQDQPAKQSKTLQSEIIYKTQ